MQTSLRNKRFLVVDDFPDMRAILRSLLQSIGATDVDIAGNGNEALGLLKKRRHSIVLCDYNLGDGKDGQQVLEEARERGLIGLDSIFIMLTSENARDMVMAAVEHIPDSYLTKPFTAELLRARLEKLTEQKAELSGVNRALVANNFASAVEQVDALLKQSPKNRLELLKIKAEALVKGNQFAAAYKIYTDVLKERELRWAQVGIGQVLMKRKEYGKAEENFREILAADPNAVDACDYLAQSQMAQSRFKDAEKSLAMAAELSPRGLKRQVLLADTAFNNRNTEVAEAAFSRAADLGKYSIQNHPAIHSGLAKSLSANGKHAQAHDVVRQMRKNFPGHQDAEFYRATATATICAREGARGAAAEALADAESAMSDATDRPVSQMALEMIKVYSDLGKKDKAGAMLEIAITNNYDNEQFLAEVRQVCDLAGLGDKLSETIREVHKKIVKINNAGVRLIKQGEFDEAISLLQQAADEMPGHKTINLNAAKALIMRMEEHGVADADIYLVRKYITHVQMAAPDDWRLTDVVTRLKLLVNKY